MFLRSSNVLTVRIDLQFSLKMLHQANQSYSNIKGIGIAEVGGLHPEITHITIFRSKASFSWGNFTAN